MSNNINENTTDAITITTTANGYFADVIANHQTVTFPANIQKEDLAVWRRGNKLIIEHKTTGEKIEFNYWYTYTSSHYKTQQLQFNNGSKLTLAEVEAIAVYQGTDNSEQLIGYRDLNETIHAQGGDDKVFSRGGDDTIDAGAGNDYVDGGSGNDTITGGLGNDVLYGRSGDDSINGDQGDDQLSGGTGNDHLVGGVGNDVLFGGEDNDVLLGNTGNDYLDGQEGDDQIEGGDGNDQLMGGTGDNQLIGGKGDDKYVYGGGFDTINNEGGGKDVIIFNDVLPEGLTFAKDNNDLIITVDGNSQQGIRVINHFLGGDYAIDLVQPAEGYAYSLTEINALARANEIPEGESYQAFVEDTDESNRFSATRFADWVEANDGDDTVFGMMGNDHIKGGKGDDHLLGGNGRANQADGDDILEGGEGNDILYGEQGNDLLKGGTGNDHYYYQTGTGKDTIDNNGGGRDVLFFIDINRNRLSFYQDKKDLVVLVDNDKNQQVRVLNHFKGGDSAISLIQPGDGFAMNRQAFEALVKLYPNTTDDFSLENTTTNVESLIHAMSGFANERELNTTRAEVTATAEVSSAITVNLS
ncbi:calcium-binding protein [Spartinivicinus poritis]|uniref:calcium-binding protein n=1 Tax=Spartinivicinus poritis TaxID=2994640 RepID=UPI00237CEE44|nr:calcium-binding protein [Spartinivicinus sp. A2-2]